MIMRFKILLLTHFYPIMVISAIKKICDPDKNIFVINRSSKFRRSQKNSTQCYTFTIFFTIPIEEMPLLC